MIIYLPSVGPRRGSDACNAVVSEQFKDLNLTSTSNGDGIANPQQRHGQPERLHHHHQQRPLAPIAPALGPTPPPSPPPCPSPLPAPSQHHSFNRRARQRQRQQPQQQESDAHGDHCSQRGTSRASTTVERAESMNKDKSMV